ncbi:MAG: RNase adapter RapZ [Gammaproteobacteria bacterium]
MAEETTTRRVIFVSGLSGAGKSVVLHTLEDLNYYCIDNLPISLMDKLAGEIDRLPENIAIGIDARNIKRELTDLPDSIKAIREHGVATELIFLDASEDVLTKRFSETRRKHPLSSDNIPLYEAITKEREILSSLSETADLRIDTSHNTVHDLRNLIRERITDRAVDTLSIQVMSFGYKFGTPRDADFIFDVRCLPNPYWDNTLRPYSGREQPVIDFLEQQAGVLRMREQLTSFLTEWIPAFENENRSYLTVAIGCTGGRHRSVYLADRLTGDLRAGGRPIILRHRDI